jgi:hypothetical protein
VPPLHSLDAGEPSARASRAPAPLVCSALTEQGFELGHSCQSRFFRRGKELEAVLGFREPQARPARAARDAIERGIPASTAADRRAQVGTAPRRPARPGASGEGITFQLEQGNLMY